MESDLPDVSPSRRWILSGLLLVAAAASLAMTWTVWRGDACPSCTGLLSVVLPFSGAIFYAGAAALSWRRPASPILPQALSLALFVHACLVAEMLLQRRWCWGCASIAAVALLAALVHVVWTPPSRMTLAAGILLGALAGFLLPFDRVEDVLTRRFWPAHILTSLPAFVDRAELDGCPHRSPVRLFTYEDRRVCQSCTGLEKRLLGQLAREFGGDLCVHKHEREAPEPGHTLPVLVILARNNRLIVYEGTPDYGEFSALMKDLIRERSSR